ncbi:UvrB/UvrC motif-containing protein [Roseimaritima sediminicola]|uniref:UvrB/UvrC motif-containing protein n=1 Tax=Roseimaritima sediminicola TaxID=2662066 RepID=UPI0012983AD5|nr:UvrB/UvrC motif-containing protein [Roseimaritima sediminicola]
MKRPRHIDHLLQQWPYDPNSLSVRLVKGADGREVLQMRVDMGLLQLETTGRPDGERPEGHDSYLDFLKARELEKGSFQLSDDQCNEVDREFMQMYHRRICWLRLEYYRRAVIDADHTLALMDISTRLAPDEEWTATHEEYRPFVWFQRTQAHALAELEESGAEAAVQAFNSGLESIREIFVQHDIEEHFENDELVQRLTGLRESLRDEYNVGSTLLERLNAAVAEEKYELAAKLRDELARRDVL